MTDKTPDIGAISIGEAMSQFTKSFGNLGKAAAEVTFHFTAQSTFGWMLQGKPDEAQAALARMTDEQVSRVLAAARELTTLAYASLHTDRGPDEQPEPAEPAEGGYRVIAERLAQAWPDDFGKDPVYTDQVAAHALAAVLPRFDQWRTAAHHYIRIIGRIEEYANRLDEVAGPDRDWSVRATDTAANLRALIIINDQTSKFETTGDLREQHDAHRRRLAAALEATPCRNWDQLLTLAEQTHDTAIARQAEAERLRALAAEILARFTQHGHPGSPCLKTVWVPTRVVAGWRAALDQRPLVRARLNDEENAAPSVVDTLGLMTTDRDRWRLEAQGHRDTIDRVRQLAHRFLAAEDWDDAQAHGRLIMQALDPLEDPAKTTP